MSGPPALLVYLAVVAALLAAYKIVKRRRDRSKPGFGDANAYEGNLVTPSADDPHRPPTADRSPSGGLASHSGRSFGDTRNTVHNPPGVMGPGGRS